ncbi:hypothetical protein [uncultured phage cr116_1]|uniref:Uncharacterized protein n=1 Tax=uncultured phage cr116_1 TaxID=2772073 RepID=A0A7M1RY69_9CAUD|nr:hypothetical protein KNV40_gp086 [uncultured phage cr116_1]QOR59357.1 hypothetical protein [uncultured phage cr116_1]DAK53091.1 MAG TPA: hypothetical protein [Crassvirales sp.]
MANKEFTKFELARMRRTAQNVEGFLKQKNKLEEKKAKIEEELSIINQQIELTDAPTVAMTGYHTEDIIKKVVTPTDQVDKNGNIIKKVTFEFIYPDTIIPPVKEEPVVDAPSSTENDETTINENDFAL